MSSTAFIARLGGFARRSHAPMTVYQLTDRLHGGRTVRVPGDQIVPTVSAWLAELGAHTPLIADLAHAMCAGDWPVAHSIGEHLSVDVAVAA